MADLHSLRVAVDLPCSRCKYDLRGLHADGRCPECGLELVASIAARVDPDFALLPPLPRPRLAGWSLLFVVLGVTVASLAQTLSFGAVAVTMLPPSDWQASIARMLPGTLVTRLVEIPPSALATALVGAIVLAHVTRQRGWRRVGIVLGLVGWLAASCLPVSSRVIAFTGIAAAIALFALSPILVDLGLRSRTYRSRPSTRQPVGPLEWAIAVGVACLVAAEWLEHEIGRDATTALRLAAGACLAMTLVGLLYLVVNAFWIWRALLAWQPILERVVDRHLSADPPTAPTSSPVSTKS
ncbi:MAG: hypothetical protein U0572_02470 [Phycisphaerales bacterium]